MRDITMHGTPPPHSTSPEPAGIDPRLLLLAAGEESALPARERRALANAVADDAELAAQVAALREDLSRLDVKLHDPATAAATTTTVDRAAREAKRAMRAWTPSPAVIGRIGTANAVEADAASQVWRWARWPLAAAAVLVAGLVGLTQLQEAPRSLDAPVALNDGSNGGSRVRPDLPGTGTSGITGQSRSIWDAADSAASIDEQAQQLAGLFEQPSFGFDTGETLGWSDELDSLNQLANLETPEMADWSAFEADG